MTLSTLARRSLVSALKSAQHGNEVADLLGVGGDLSPEAERRLIYLLANSTIGIEFISDAEGATAIDARMQDRLAFVLGRRDVAAEVFTAMELVFDHYVTSQADLDTLMGLSLTDDETVGVKRGIQVYGYINAKGNVSAYGTGNPPIVSAFGLVDGTWTKTGGYTNVYDIDFDISNITVNIARLQMLVDDAYITRVTSIALCDSTAGSYYNDNTLIGTDGDGLRKVYYHPSGSTNPNSDGKVVRISKWDHACKTQNQHSITGIEADGCAHDNGAVFTTQSKALSGTTPLPQTLSKMLMRRGTKHTSLIGSGTIQDCVWHLHDDTIAAEPTVGVCGVYEVEVTGLSVSISNSHIISTESETTRRSGSSQPGTMHSSDASTYTSLSIQGCSVRGTNGDTWGGADALTVDGLFIDRASSVSCLGNKTTTTAIDPIVMDRVLARHSLALAQISNGIIYGRRYATWNNYAAVMSADGGSSFPMFYFLNNNFDWIFNNATLVTLDTGGSGSVFFQGGGTGTHNVTVNNSFIYTRGYRASYGLTGGIGGTRNLIITRSNSPPLAVDNFDYNVNLWVNNTNVSSYLATVGLTTSGNADTDVYNFADACLLNGLAGAANGDFRLSANVANLQFGDSAYLGDHNIGAQSHWDFNAQASASGPPSRWPAPPVSLADCRQFVLDPSNWDFYP